MANLIIPKVKFFSYFVAKFAQASGVGWILLGFYAGVVKGSMKWEWILFFTGIILFGLGYALEKVLLKLK